MIRVVMDTSSLISLGMINVLRNVAGSIKINVPSAVKSELEEMASHKDREGMAARNALKMISKEIEAADIKDVKRVESLLSKDVNRGEAECFVCCIENGIKILVMDDIDAAYSLEGPSIANEIKIKTSVAALVQVHRKGIINKDELKKHIRELIKIREWEGGALEVLANKYLGKM